jgi:serine protease Do
MKKYLLLIFMLLIFTACETKIDSTKALVEVTVYLDMGSDDGVPVVGAARGTGFFLEYKGYPFVVTAGHVCRNASRMEVADKETEIIFTDFEQDICLLKLPILNFIPQFLKLAESDVNVNDMIYSISNKYPYEYGIKHGGYAGNLSTYSDNFRATSLLSFRGNSGSPTFNSRGEIIGILSAVYTETHHTLIVTWINLKNALDEVTEQLTYEDSLK